MVGAGKLFGLHLHEVETTLCQRKPTTPGEPAGAEGWVGSSRASPLLPMSQRAAGPGEPILSGSLLFSSPALSSLCLCLSQSCGHFSPSLCPWLGLGCDPVGQDARATPQALARASGASDYVVTKQQGRTPAASGSRFLLSGCSPFPGSLKSGSFSFPGLAQRLCLS